MKEFLLTLKDGFIFILVCFILIILLISSILLVNAIVPKTILYVVITIFVIWFVGAVIR